mgnify:FL=1
MMRQGVEARIEMSGRIVSSVLIGIAINPEKILLNLKNNTCQSHRFVVEWFLFEALRNTETAPKNESKWPRGVAV